MTVVITNISILSDFICIDNSCMCNNDDDEFRGLRVNRQTKVTDVPVRVR